MDAFSGEQASVLAHRRARIRHAAETVHNMVGLNHPPVVAVVENAPGTVGPEVYEHLMIYPWAKTMQEWTASSDIYGVPPHPEIRDRQTGRMESRLAQDLLSFSENMATYPASLGGQDPDKLKTKLATQLMGWERIVEYNKNKPYMKPRTCWSAKHSTGNDDLAVAALMMDWAEVFFSAERDWRYGEWIRTWVAPRLAKVFEATPSKGADAPYHQTPELGGQSGRNKSDASGLPTDHGGSKRVRGGAYYPTVEELSRASSSAAPSEGNNDWQLFT